MTTQEEESAILRYYLRFYKMPKQNIEMCARLIEQSYIACRYLDSVAAGDNSVKVSKSQKLK